MKQGLYNCIFSRFFSRATIKSGKTQRCKNMEPLYGALGARILFQVFNILK